MHGPMMFADLCSRLLAVSIHPERYKFKRTCCVAYDDLDIPVVSDRIMGILSELKQLVSVFRDSPGHVGFGCRG